MAPPVAATAVRSRPRRVRAAAPASVGTREALVEAAAALLQRGGWSSFSYRDVALAVGIRTASIHYWFPAKADLGLALIARFADYTRARAATLEAAHPDARQRLSALGDEIGRACAGGPCPLSLLEADYAVLPPAMQQALRELIDAQIAMLARWLAEGRAAGSLRFPGTPAAQARLAWSVIEHGTQFARSHPRHPLKPVMRQLMATMDP